MLVVSATGVNAVHHAAAVTSCSSCNCCMCSVCTSHLAACCSAHHPRTLSTCTQPHPHHLSWLVASRAQHLCHIQPPQQVLEHISGQGGDAVLVLRSREGREGTRFRLDHTSSGPGAAGQEGCKGSNANQSGAALHQETVARGGRHSKSLLAANPQPDFPGCSSTPAAPGCHMPLAMQTTFRAPPAGNRPLPNKVSSCLDTPAAPGGC